MMTKANTSSKTKKVDGGENMEEISTKVTAKQEKVERRRSIEEYVARKRWKEENEDLVDLYDTECY